MANTVATVTYFGSKGTALTQQYYPNTRPRRPIGSQTYCPCAAGICPVGYPYETSNGNSIDNGIQLQLQRRLRSGLGGNVSYTLNQRYDAPSGNARSTGRSGRRARPRRPVSASIR